MGSFKLTDRLLDTSRSELSAATTHPFLTAAGTGNLTSKALTEWLVQDKYYQFAYVNFIGRMISKLDLSDYAFPSGEDSVGQLKWTTLTTLLEALKAIKAEIDFYNSTVNKYGLKLEQKGEDDVTTKYRKLFEESSAVDKPIVWGLTVLWATEYCYLRAWSHAKEQSGSTGRTGTHGAVAALHNEFIPNWTSDEFKRAVDALADVANLWADRLEKDQLEECKELWGRVLDLETKFWPDV